MTLETPIERNHVYFEVQESVPQYSSKPFFLSRRPELHPGENGMRHALHYTVCTAVRTPPRWVLIQATLPNVYVNATRKIPPP